jgi:hypothetical protein
VLKSGRVLSENVSGDGKCLFWNLAVLVGNIEKPACCTEAKGITKTHNNSDMFSVYVPQYTVGKYKMIFSQDTMYGNRVEC